MAAQLQAAVLVVPDSGQDRALALPLPGGYLVAVADGAGETGGGAEAAQRVIARVREAAVCTSAAGWCQLLLELDQELAGSGGETTAVIARVDERRVVGASVGDSQAWLIRQEAATNLTVSHRGKPLLGSGASTPVPFDASRGEARVLCGSDGLFKYTPADRIRALAAQGPPDSAAAALARCVRLPSGALHDDVAIVIVSE